MLWHVSAIFAADVKLHGRGEEPGMNANVSNM